MTEDQKEKDISKHEEMRRKLWISIASTVANGECKSIGSPSRWANAALVEFDKTFSEKDK